MYWLTTPTVVVDLAAGAAHAGVSLRTIQRWVRAGFLTPHRGMVTLDDIDRAKEKARRPRPRLTTVSFSMCYAGARSANTDHTDQTEQSWETD